MMVVVRFWLLVSVAAVGLADDAPPLKPEDVTPGLARTALQRGVAFLLQSQNPDGSWGGAWGSLTTWSGDTWTNPESHRAWRVATSGLCCMALAQAGRSDAEMSALDRGIDYLIAAMPVKRPNEWDTMNCWPNIYGLQALAVAYGLPRYANTPRHDALRRAAETTLAQLAQTQSLSGGWGYLEFSEPRTARPQWATSFTTSAGVVALVDTQAQGLSVYAPVLARAVKAIRRCRLPNGAYTYSVQAIAHPRLIGSIDRVNGSLGRIQSCNLALLLAGDEVTPERLRSGLEVFFREHRFLDLALFKPVPHEAFYQNSGYFYMFGHYYAARVIAQLPASERGTWWPQLQYEIIKIQQHDGSTWDYDHHGYAKPYGTAYSVLALSLSLQAELQAAPSTSRASAAP